MPSLGELQRAFSAATLFADTAATVRLGIVAGSLDAEARLVVYRNNVLGNYRHALAATYPVVRRLIGAPFFDAAIESFVRAYPSTHGDVNRYGAAVSRFLVTYPPARAFAYLPDVARLEWAIDQANIAGEAPAFDLDALARVPLEAMGELRFSLHPSAQILRSPHPIFRIWQVNRPGHLGNGRIDPGEGDEALLVRRAPEGVLVERLGAAAHAFLAALLRKRSLADAQRRAMAVEPSFDLAATLKGHVAAQTIVAFRLPPSST